MKKTSSLEMIMQWGGRALMLLGIAFVIQRFWTYKDELGESIADPVAGFYILIFSLFYGLTGLLLSSGWLSLLRAQGVEPLILSWKQAWPLYGKTQIAKYIPGNVFHIAGRHALGAQQGIAHAQLAKAAALEIVFVLVSAALLSLLALNRILHMLNASRPFFLAVVLLICLLLLITFITYKKYPRYFPREVFQWRQLAFSLSCYLAFFILSGLLFTCLIIVIINNAIYFDKWVLLLGGYAFAWAGGFIIPGAPGGLGVREAILLTLFETTFPTGGLLISILAFRAITLLGDLAFFAAAIFIPNRALK